MIFGPVSLGEALGGILAHSLKTRDRVLRKGARLDAEALRLLEAAGYAEITVARLEPGDVAEGEAASQVGEWLQGEALRRSEDVHGRVNLFAAAAGLLRLDVPRLKALNGIDEAITLATLADRAVVEAGDLVATVKIIPFAVSAAIMARARACLRGPPAMQVKPFQPLLAGLVLSRLPQVKAATLAGTVKATRARLLARGGQLLPARETAHGTASIAGAVVALLAEGAELILIAGATAATDRRDVAPQAIVEAGGEIIHFGMPVDPGNLICVGRIGRVPALVLPGCARSPALNGIDWVLDRLFAREPLGPREIAAMGVGGLLKEIAGRPVPRAGARPNTLTPPVGDLAEDLAGDLLGAAQRP
jgi:molybdenum cofactor cytidylyltransferase